MKENRTVLMVALDQIANFRGYILPLNMANIRQISEQFNKNGLRVLLATAEGMKLLEDPHEKEGNHQLDLNFPLSLIQMQEQDFEGFCAVYLISSEPLEVFCISDIPQLRHVYEHCTRKNKLVALQCGHLSRIVYPTPYPEVDNLIEKIQKEPDNQAVLDFSHHMAELSKARLEKRLAIGA